MSKNIYQTVDGFGNSAYRAMKRNNVVVIQESWKGRQWKDIARTSLSTFEELAEEYDIYNSYNQNPAHLYHIAQRIKGN